MLNPAKVFLAVAFVLAGYTLLAAPLPARAMTYGDSYMPPELAYSDQLRQKVTIPRRTNINQGSLNQLKILPGFDEELALKVMRNRPFAGIQDFYQKLPGLDKKRVQRLIEQVQPKLQFK